MDLDEVEKDSSKVITRPLGSSLDYDLTLAREAISEMSRIATDKNVKTVERNGLNAFNEIIRMSSSGFVVASKPVCSPTPSTTSNPDESYPSGINTASFVLAQAEAKKINDENLKLTPTDIPDKTIICQVITDSTVPIGQRELIQRIGQEMAKPENNYIERIVRLKDDEPGSSMDKLRGVMLEQEKLNPGCEIEYYVACARKSDVEAILEGVPKLEEEFGRKLKIGAIAFEPPKLDVNAVQVHAIMLALRALRKGPDSLREAYKLLTGKEMKDENGNDITDLVEMMKKALFKVPPARIDIDKVDDFNRLVEKYILDAA